jgi:hypothetical protein
VRLEACAQGSAHAAKVMRILAIGFLRAAPGGMAKEIDADRARKVAILRADFDPHRFTDAALQIGIEARAARHGAGETGGMPARHAARAIGEPEGRDAEPFDPAARAIGIAAPAAAAGNIGFEEALTRHHADFFSECRFGEDGIDQGFDYGGRKAGAGQKIGHGNRLARPSGDANTSGESLILCPPDSRIHASRCHHNLVLRFMFMPSH